MKTLSRMFVTSEEVGQGGVQAVRRPPQKLLLPLHHPASPVLIVQTAEEEAVVPHLEEDEHIFNYLLSH